MPLNGYDLSSNNSAAQVDTALTGDFVILKASEGKSYQWTGAQTIASRARAAGKLVGWYHFAWPGNGGAADASNFLAGSKAQPGDLLALDWEPYSQTNVTPAMAFPYIGDFATAVHDALGAWPMFYTNDDQLSKIKAAASAADWEWLTTTLPLWKAGVGNVYVSDPSKGPGNTYGFGTVATFQWSETPQDKNVFYGDAAFWRELAVPSKEAPVTVQSLGVSVDPKTADAMAAMIRLLDFYDGMGDKVQATQGSYSTGVAASGNTHGGGGAVDLARFRRDGREWTWAELVKIANRGRQVGFAAWPRERIEGTWERHVHMERVGCSDATQAAKNQWTAYKNGRDGLAGNGPDTPGCTRAYVNTTWDTYVEPPEVTDMTPEQDARLKAIESDLTKLRPLLQWAFDTTLGTGPAFSTAGELTKAIRGLSANRSLDGAPEAPEEMDPNSWAGEDGPQDAPALHAPQGAPACDDIAPH